MPNSLSRRLDVGRQFDHSAASHPARLMSLDQRRQAASPYAAAGVPPLPTTAEQGTAKNNENGGPASPVSPKRPAPLQRQRELELAPLLQALLLQLTRLAEAEQLRVEATSRRFGLFRLPVGLTDAGTVPPAAALAASSVSVDYAACEGPYCTICVDLAEGEAARITRVGPPLTLAPPCFLGTARLQDRKSLVLSTSKDPKQAALHACDETELDEWCSATTPAVDAVAITVYLAPSRRLLITWGAADVLSDPVVGTTEVPVPGECELSMGRTDNIIVLQTAVVGSFEWRVEAVK
jgi:hypothetical protein